MRLTFNMLLRQTVGDLSTTRLMRHQDNRMIGSMTTYKLWRTMPDEFDRYISMQSRNRLVVGGHVAHFVLDPLGDLIFTRLHRVQNVMLNSEPIDFRYMKRLNPTDVASVYQLEPVEALAPYEGLIVVDWGPGTRSWCQRADRQDKQILEIRRDVRDVEWPGYLDLIINQNEVAVLAPNWRSKLAAATGVYLLLCPESGSQYVGVALGQGGFLERFGAYERTGHGGNTLLKVRLTQHSAPMDISILEVFGSAVTQEQAYAAETRWKNKLGSRAFGLNAN